MTPDRFREILDLLGWSQRSLAKPLECSDRLPRAWATGADAIPPLVAAWLEALARAHATNPPPKGWRRRPAGRAA